MPYSDSGPSIYVALIGVHMAGIFGMIISKAERMGPWPGSMYNGTSHPGQSHFVIEIEDDPFKCGKHPVEVYQSIQTGELTEFKFHKEEQELSSRCVHYCQKCAQCILTLYYRSSCCQYTPAVLLSIYTCSFVVGADWQCAAGINKG